MEPQAPLKDFFFSIEFPDHQDGVAPTVVQPAATSNF